MRLKRFVTPARKGVVFTDLGRIVGLLGLLLLPVLLVAVLSREWSQATDVGAAAVICMATGLALRRRPSPNLTVPEALVITALAYFVYSVLGALLFLPVAPFIDGFFEAMSGITTTGLSVMPVEALPDTLLFFRAYSQWIGGAGIVIVSLLFLMGPALNASRLFGAEYGRNSLTGSVRSTAKIVITIYVTLTVLGFAAFSVAGMSPFQALLHIMSTVSTGGFGSFSESIGAFPEASVRIVVLVFMFAGAVSFVSFHALRQRRLRDVAADPQLRLLAGLVVGATIVFALVRQGTPALLTDAFHAASAVSTTGFGLSGCAGWAPEAVVTTIVLMFVGGGAGSTAGGLKLFRLLICLHLVKRLVARVLLPSESKIVCRYNRNVVSPDEVLAVGGTLVASLFLVGVTAVALTAAGAEPIAALFESTSALATVGLSMGVTSETLPAWTKLVLALNMWAGRLEVLPVLILFYPPLWRRQRSST